MFCPICGKESNGICKDCYLKIYPIMIKDFQITICKKCGKIFPENSDDEENLKRMIMKNLSYGEMIEIRDLKISYSEDEKFEKFMNVNVSLFCEYKGEKFKEEQNIKVKAVRNICKACSRKFGHYYEAVLQLRGDKEKIKDAYNKIDKNFVSGVEELKEGIDVYLTSKDYGTSLIKEFADEGAIVKRTNKIWGIKNGKRIYRDYMLARFSEIRVNDKIRYKGKIYNVLKTGKFLICEDEKGKKRQFRMKECEKVE